jgi:Cytochrome c554 and c-prime
MNSLGRPVGIFGGLLILLAYTLYVAATGEPLATLRKEPVFEPKPVSGKYGALGVASCAAQACHGSPEALLGPASLVELADPHAAVSWKSSYFAWTNHDQHANAYRSLESDLSKQIMLRLHRTKPATHDADCLACHANPTLATRTDETSRALHTEGVSCEACHGNADQWRAKHIAWPKQTARGQLYPDGMAKLYDLGVRAETCAGCHVGAPASGDMPLRDVNHDLIAAGHPRLMFEYATFLRNMPPHWTEKDRSRNGHPARPAGYEAQVWLVGQAACAEAALNLSAARAELAAAALTQSARGPELAEFNCFACHHNLKPDSWRAQPGHFEGRKIGGLLWNPSHRFFSTANDDVRSCLEKTLLVEKTISKPEATAALAKDAAEEWRKVRDKFVKPDREMINQTVEFLRPDESFWKKLDWDQAALLYTGLVAVENARRDLRRTRNEDAELTLIDLHRELRLPRILGEQQFNSPIDFKPEALREPFMKLLTDSPAKAPR